MPGVHAVLTADDLPPRMAHRPNPDAGAQPVDQDAAHAARARARRSLLRRPEHRRGDRRHRYLAEDAAAAVEVDFDVLAAVSDCRDAVEAGRAARAQPTSRATSRLSCPMSYGDVDAAFAGAAHVFEEEMCLHRGGGHDARRPRRAGELRRGGRHADGVVGDADAASRPRHARRSARAQSRIDPRDRAVRGRRLRHQGAVLCRGGGDPGRGA